MEIILNFLVDNYLWFLIISLILVFGLIGYIVDTHEKKTPKLHFGDDEEVNNDTIEEDKSLADLTEETDTLEPEVLVEETPVEPQEDAMNLTINEAIDNNQENIQNELPNQ